jgi:subtilisin family serine protease
VDSQPNQVIVRFAQGVSPSSTITSLSPTLDLASARPVGSVGAQLLTSKSKSTATLITTLKSRQDVLYAEPNYIGSFATTPNDVYYNQLWGLPAISTPTAWDISRGSRNYVVAVADTGVDYNHPDLVANLWSAPAAYSVNIGGVTINCAAGTHGFNAITRTCDPADDNSHGTHVAGTIGATGNNSLGVTGVNWATSIMALKMINSQGNLTLSDALDAMSFARQVKSIFPSTANIKVISNSWFYCVGIGCASNAFANEIYAAAQAGILFVAAAGNFDNNNDITPVYPANHSGVISVAATDSTDSRASFSDYGASTVLLGAPGVNVLSTYPSASYGYNSGTSMAAPHVSGALTLLLSACPALTDAALWSTLIDNVDQVPALAGVVYTGGRLNVDRAIRSCPEFQINNVTLTSGTYPYTSTGSIVATNVTISDAASVTYIAPTSIRLLPDFHVVAGSASITFRASTTP